MVYTGISGQGLRQDEWVYYPFQGSGGMTAHPTQAWGQPWQRLGLKNSDFTEEGKLKKDAPPGQLYDIAADRGQTTNLYQAHPERVASMEKRLEQLLAPAPAP